MRLAVFFYADAATTMEDAAWWQHLLHAMVQQAGQHELILFTNKPALFSFVQKGIRLQEYALPSGILVRRRTLHRWQQGARQAGAKAVVCFGLHSFRPGPMPTYVFLPPYQTAASKALQATKVHATGFWVNTSSAKTGLQKQGISNTVLLHGGPHHTPTDAAFDAGAFKEQHTGGCEYFLYAGTVAAIPHLVGLLKAFSKFKHRQKSSWKLVLLPLGGDAAGVAALQDLLASYKYRNDVVLPPWAQTQRDAPAFFAAAYAFVQPVPVQPYGHFLHDALGAALPIIATSDPQHKEIAGNAALYYEAGDEGLLATCLMQVYKDEALRSRLAEAAHVGAGQIGWQQTAAAAWHSLAGVEK